MDLSTWMPGLAPAGILPTFWHNASPPDQVGGGETGTLTVGEVGG